MAKHTFPSTTLQPLQVLDFILGEGLQARAIFLPQPDQSRTKVAHVAVLCIHAGMFQQSVLPNQANPQNVIEAAELAWKFAQAEATRVGRPITAIRLQGQEFLEQSDVEAITNTPVTLN
jgi:hypothetical protein